MGFFTTVYSAAYILGTFATLNRAGLNSLEALRSSFGAWGPSPPSDHVFLVATSLIMLPRARCNWNNTRAYNKPQNVSCRQCHCQGLQTCQRWQPAVNHNFVAELILELPAYVRDGIGSPGHGSVGHQVSDFGRVGSGHRSVCQTRCLTRFWVLTCTFITALFLQSNIISANSVSVRFPSLHYWFTYFSSRNIYLLTCWLSLWRHDVSGFDVI